MRKYKYEIGDMVKYTESVSRDEECKTCGHIETLYEYKNVIGKIENRKFETFLDVSNGFVTTDNVEVTPDGQIIHKPYLNKIEVVKPTPAYKVDGNWYPETHLKSISQ